MPLSSSEDYENVLEKILNIIQELGKELQLDTKQLKKAGADSAFDKDLGLDSLARVELISRLEKAFDITLGDTVFANAENPGQLTEEVLNTDPKISEDSSFRKKKITMKDRQSVENIPSDINTLLEVFHWHKENNPERPHITFYQDEKKENGITYGDFYSEAVKVCSSLTELDIQPKERVGIMLPTCEEYFFVFMGIIMAGGIPVPVYPPFRRSQLKEHLLRHERIFNNCQAAFMITTPEIKKLGSLLQSHVKSMKKVLTPGDLQSPKKTYEPEKASANEIAFLQYTSGSTGDPKGVALTHQNLISNIKGMARALRVTQEDIVVSWLPLYHDMGLIGTWMSSFYHGCPLILMSPVQFLAKPERWLWAIHQFEGTISAAPNFAYELCYKRINDENMEGLDLSSWRISINGAEPVSPKTIKRFNTKFEPFGLSSKTMMPAYGLAEGSVALTFPPPDREALIKKIDRDVLMRKKKAKEVEESFQGSMEVVSCGFPLDQHQIRIVDEWDNELPSNKVGQIQFKGPSATKGYFNNPEKTKELFHSDEWLDTGDTGFISRGELYVTGRVKDIIIKAGRNISPQELEEAVGDIDHVRKGCVVVFADREPGEESEKLVVVAETREKSKEHAEEIIKKIHSLTFDLLGVGADDVRLVPPHTVLKTSSGKVRRSSCQKLYKEGKLGKSSSKLKTFITNSSFALFGSYVLDRISHSLQLVKDWLYLFYIWPLFALFIPPIILLALILPFKYKWSVLGTGTKAFLFMAGIPIRVQGGENLDKIKGECVFVANHSSYLDGPIIASYLDRPVSFIAKEELKSNFITNWLLSSLRTIFVNRQDPAKAVEQVKETKRLFKKEAISLFFFPEGTFTRVPGLRPFHLGGFLLASELDLPIIPITIEGTRSILLAGQTWLPRRGKLTITIGEPIFIPKTEDKTSDSWTAALELKSLSRKEILAHCSEPDLAPPDQ